VRIGFTFSVDPIHALAALEELERVDGEPEPQLPARGGHVLGHLLRAAAVARRLGRGEHHEAETAGRGRGVHHLDPLAAPAVARQRVLGLAGGLGRAGQPT
jgi:hypothetical protein